MKPGTLKKVRERTKDYHRETTVITRDGNIVIRVDCGSPRNIDLITDMVSSWTARTFKVSVERNVFHGRKGIYTHYWAEAIIKKDEIPILEGHLYL
jgi:hypothetical protein